jgi:ElaB/YqjD/DUF883 family membrane-anchored ribosome-binding protein
MDSEELANAEKEYEQSGSLESFALLLDQEAEPLQEALTTFSEQADTKTNEIESKISMAINKAKDDGKKDLEDKQQKRDRQIVQEIIDMVENY